MKRFPSQFNKRKNVPKNWQKRNILVIICKWHVYAEILKY